jgi:Polyketide cyclase / dehydrase and lipid transport
MDSWPVIIRVGRRCGPGARDSERLVPMGNPVSVAVVDCAVEIRRSAEDAFDYVTDISREFEWNPRTKRIVKLTDGPVAVGTRWEGQRIAGDPMFIDFVAFDRPKSWRSTGRSRGLLVGSEGHVDPTPDGARLTLHVELAPQGRLRLIAPLLGRIMRGPERQNVVAIKERLEDGAQTNGGGQQ